MTNIDNHGRPEPPLAANESDTLIGFLEWQRSTLEWKTRDLDSAGLGATVAASSMTLGGILKHLAWVEDHWFSYCWLGQPRSSVWLSAEATSQHEWEWTSASLNSPDELREMWRQSVERSRLELHDALSRGGLDQLASRATSDGSTPSLRWILVHMIEEYARHNGHADLLRESVDGLVGE